MKNRIAQENTQVPLGDVRLEVLLFKVNDCWIAQGLQVDIACQHQDPQEVLNIFEHAVVGHVCLSLEHKVDPFDGSKTAPKQYWQRYRSGLELRKVLELEYGKIEQSLQLESRSRMPEEATVRVG